MENRSPERIHRENKKAVEHILGDEAVDNQAKLALLTVAADTGVYSEHELGERLATLERMMDIDFDTQ